MNMNKNLKSKILPPSPRSTHARKPFVNLTSFINNSQQSNHNTNKHNSNSYRSRISVDDKSRPKIKIVHCRKNERSDSNNRNKQQYGKNRDRQQYGNSRDRQQYGNNRDRQQCGNIEDEKMRQKQTFEYLMKCSRTERQLKRWQQKGIEQKKNILKQFEAVIGRQKESMEEQVMRIREVYNKHIRMLEEKKNDKIALYQQADEQMGQFIKNLVQIQQDIHHNLAQCISQFTKQQYHSIMGQYWKILQQAQHYLASPPSLSNKSQLDHTLSLNSIHQQFTFSKTSNYDTPPLQKTFRNIKQVESHGFTGSDALKESIIDTRFCFHDVNPFIL